MGLKRNKLGIAAMASVLALTGCGWSDLSPVRSTTGRAPQLAEVPNADETVRGTEDPPIVTLPLSKKLQERRLAKGDELPTKTKVPKTNLNAVPVTAALQAVLSGTDIALSWEAGTFENHLVSVANLSGPLPQVVERICASAKVFCHYRNGMLTMKEKETFVIDLPAMPSAKASSNAANSMADAIESLVGEKVKVDAQGGNLIYTTDAEGQEKVHEYLDQLHNGRPLVVMQLYIWEVRLDKRNSTGINWKNFKTSRLGNAAQNGLLSGATGVTNLLGESATDILSGSKSAAAGSGLFNLNLGGNVDADVVLQFLATQGQVQTISNPQMTFVSGANADFRVGGKVRYISQVGTLTNNTSGAGGTTNSNTNTVQTDSLDKGLSVTVGGSYENGVISAALDLALQDVIDLNPTNSGGGVINLPETTERKMSTSVRVRPGDNLLMAGLVSSRDSNQREGIPTPFGGRIPTLADDELNNSELVILVKPSVVLFSDEAAKKAELEPVIIDKDGAKSLGETASQPVALQPASPPSAPVAAASAVPAMTPLPTPPADTDAPVNRRLLQRGLRHALDGDDRAREGGTL